MSEFGATTVPDKYAALVRAAAARWGVPPALLAAQINAESSFNPDAVSEAGAIGIAQFMPDTARSMGVNPRDPASAIDGMAKLMSSYKKRYGNWEDALVAYHDGPGGVGSPGPRARSYVDKIMGVVGSAAAGITGAIPGVSELQSVATLLDKVSDPDFLKRVGLFVMGANLVLFGLLVAFSGSIAKAVRGGRR